jgi:hypothetical protein
VQNPTLGSREHLLNSTRRLLNQIERVEQVFPQFFGDCRRVDELRHGSVQSADAVGEKPNSDAELVKLLLRIVVSHAATIEHLSCGVKG